MKKILIIKLGNTFLKLRRQRGDFEDWIISGSGLDISNFEVANVVAGESLPDSSQYEAVILTGSHDMVTNSKDWSERTVAWIPHAIQNNIPILGICYGHQLLAHSLGGIVGQNPNGCEYGVVKIKLTLAGTKNPMFKGLPDEFMVYVSHSQSVLKLPKGSTLLASGSRERCHAFAWGSNVWGVQFHPEFDAEIAGSYIDKHANNLLSEEQDPVNLHHLLKHTALSQIFLKQFVELI